MLQAQISRKDGNQFASLPIDNEARLIDQLRPYLTANEVKLLGFDAANDEETEGSFLPSLLIGLGATASTTLLFTVFAFFATLGLPEAATLV